MLSALVVLENLECVFLVPVSAAVTTGSFIPLCTIYYFILYIEKCKNILNIQVRQQI